MIGGVERLNKNAVQRIVGKVGSIREGELVEAAEGEWKFGVKIKGGGGEAATRGGELGGEKKLQGELGFAGATLGDDFCDSIAGDSAS